MSRRVQQVLRGLAEQMEVYWIDESFLWWTANLPWREMGEQIRERVLRWTGLPVGVGIAPSKTLAKLANKLAKAGNDVHVLADAGAMAEALSCITLTDLWGVSTRLARRLKARGWFTMDPAHMCIENVLNSLRAAGLVVELAGKMEPPKPEKTADHSPSSLPPPMWRPSRPATS